MNVDNFLNQSSWQILEIIAKEPSSPVNISKEINTSVAYVSQQLKILEAIDLVTKQRTKAVDKGQPRLVYSIAREIIHLTLLMNKFPFKKQIKPDVHKKIILKIWALEKTQLHYYLEKLYWKLESHIGEIEGIFLEEKEPKSKIMLVTSNKKINQIVIEFLKETKKEIDCVVIDSYKKIPKIDSLYKIYEKEEDENKI